MSGLSAAAESTDLHAPFGGLLAGYGVRIEPALGQHDPITARALLLEQAQRRLILISCDLLGFSTATDAELRRRIAHRLQTQPANVLLCCTHTHGGPCSMALRGFARADAWLEQAGQRIEDLAASLPARLQPATMRSAIGDLPGIGFNRQDRSCPIDQRLLTAAVEDPHGQRIATILNYAVHPVILAEQNRYFTADYPGFACSAVERAAGGMALFIQGSCGDVNPLDRGGSFARAERAGERVAESAMTALETATTAPAGSKRPPGLNAVEMTVQLPLDPPPSPQELDDIRTHLLRNRRDPQQPPATSAAKSSIYQLAWADELEAAVRDGTVPAMLSVRLAAARVGELRLIAFPLEVYSEIGLRIRQRLAPQPIIIAAYTGGLIGYATTTRAKDQGGYGPATSHRFFPELLTAIGKEADDVLVDQSVALLKALN